MNENNLVVKNVEFNGANLRAAQDTDGRIYAGVKWMCDGIGLSENKIKNERLKIQKDMVLSQGMRFLPLGTGNSDTEVLCLKLDYVPLWLAKISITPTMKKETPEVVENLISYQLKAKDVLADAFLNKKYKSETDANVNGRVLQVQLPDQKDYSQDFQKIDKALKVIREENLNLKNNMQNIYKDMGTLSSFLVTYINNQNQNQNANKSVTTRAKKIVYYPYSDDELNEWKQDQYALMDKIICEHKCILTNKRAMLKYIYDYMRQHYGICWEQEVKDYKERYYLDKKPYTIDVVYDNEQFRSIFGAIVVEIYHQNINHNKILSKAKINTATKDFDTYKIKIAKLNESAAHLANKYYDTSVHNMNTWQMMYKELTKECNVNWRDLTSNYIRTYGKRPSAKKEIIAHNAVLYRKTMKCIDSLMSKKTDINTGVA